VARPDEYASTTFYLVHPRIAIDVIVVPVPTARRDDGPGHYHLWVIDRLGAYTIPIAIRRLVRFVTTLYVF
jgi:hypothetical protein